MGWSWPLDQLPIAVDSDPNPNPLEIVRKPNIGALKSNRDPNAESHLDRPLPPILVKKHSTLDAYPYPTIIVSFGSNYYKLKLIQAASTSILIIDLQNL